MIRHRGKIVAGLNLIPSEWSIGGIRIKVAEMGCVATLPKYRHMGLQRRLVSEFLKRAAKLDYDLSAIEGIPYFYRQFGYEYALPLSEETRIRIDQIPDYEPKCDIRPFTSTDIRKAMQLLSKSQRRFYVHSIRSRGIWSMQQETGIVAEHRFEGHVTEKDGKMTAYFRTNEHQQNRELVLSEVTDLDQQTTQSVLRFLKDNGKQHGHETLVTAISYHDPFTEHVVAIGGLKRLPPYAWQIRATDYVKLFLKMKRLFEKRLSESTFRHLTEKIDFNFCRYTVQMAIKDGMIVNVERLATSDDRTMILNPLVFTQLLLGHRSREELERIYPDFIVRPIRKHLVDVLFPKLPSYIHTTY